MSSRRDLPPSIRLRLLAKELSPPVLWRALKGAKDSLRDGGPAGEARRAIEARSAIESLEASWAQWRIDEHGRAVAQREELAELRNAIAELRDIQTKQLQLSRAHYDNIGGLRRRLIALRRSPAYAATFENHRPLVSVPIATFNAADLLIDRAIASVRAQTYDRWEIVVVGDGCTDDTAARLEGLGDPRIRFVNLPFRTVYPDAAAQRWLVAGAGPWNYAVELCGGDWLAPLDDDDEFLPHHMETLLPLALERQAELAYGALEQVGPGLERTLFAFPPQLGQTGMQAAIYLRALDFFELDIYSWAVDEPSDWNAVRRMRDAGVRMAATEEPVARYYPSGGARA